MQTNLKKLDFLILGAGIVGLAIAREILNKNSRAKVLLLEKESTLAFHASGRNSGVLHAGFYYTLDSLKAKFTADGNRRLREYCAKKSIPVNLCGKIVSTRSAEDIPSLFELHKRGQALDVPLELINEAALEKLEPNARTFDSALSSPTTGVVDPKVVCKSFLQDIQEVGGKIVFEAAFEKRLGENKILAGGIEYEAGKIINTAGLYADKVAAEFGFSQDYRILPFKGVYLKRKDGGKSIKTNIYPVPNLNNPFLGVHFTITKDGSEKIGPTAIPAFWRENYSGFSRFQLDEFAQILGLETKLFLRNDFNFRDLAFTEMRKYLKANLISDARPMVKNMADPDLWEWGTPGIRAQLINIKDFKLAKDFIVEGDQSSIHVLNAVSPAFTGSIPFAEHVVAKYL